MLNLVIDYKKQGITSSPSGLEGCLSLFPAKIEDLCLFINRILLIDIIPNMATVNVPKEHFDDSSIRNVEMKIQTLLDRGELNTTIQRPFEGMLLGNCRDLALFMCSILRNHSIPARVRSGFGTFFHPLKKFDHWVCEYWSTVNSHWIKVDPWMAQINYYKDILPDYLKDGLLNIEYNPYNVAETYFYPGATAWLNCRRHNDNFDSYGTYEEELKGEWFVRDNMLRDLLCLLKYESLSWDCWGKMGREYKVMNSFALNSLDLLAEHLTRNTVTLAQAQEVLKNFNINFSDFVI